jgi:hypothetical protein
MAEMNARIQNVSNDDIRHGSLSPDNRLRPIFQTSRWRKPAQPLGGRYELTIVIK